MYANSSGIFRQDLKLGSQHSNPFSNICNNSRDYYYGFLSLYTVPLMGVKRCGRKFFSALGSARTNLDSNLGSMRLATTLGGIVVNL